MYFRVKVKFSAKNKGALSRFESSQYLCAICVDMVVWVALGDTYGANV